MNKKTNKIDWTRDENKAMLVYQRKSLWSDYLLDAIASWLELRQGMTVVDVGCGLGYLGYTYWKYYGIKGNYVGVDKTDVLLKEAAQSAKEWAKKGKAEFINGDAYHLPLDNNSADVVMCQTLLLHLEEPVDALTEMIRVVKPGGVVVCHEPDHLNGLTNKPVWSLPDLSFDDELLLKKYALICHNGRIKLGRGDNQIGIKIPFLMKQNGLHDIDIKVNDHATYLEPPYETESQKIALKKIKSYFLDKRNYTQMRKRGKEEYFAGGGNEKEYKRIRKITTKIRRKLLKQIENNEYACCNGSSFYVIKGVKPK